MNPRADRSLLSKRVTPTLLKESAGDQSCCIFRVSHRLRRINSKAYEPDLVSIGPYHHGKEQLLMLEEHKPRFLRLFIEEAEKNGVGFEELVEAVSKREEALRSSYSENLMLDRDEVINMMLLDGCFILMLFFMVSRKIEITGQDDPIFRMPWILPTIRSDLLLLENQVPLFILEILFVTSRISPSGGLYKMAFKFFSYSSQLPERSRPSNFDIKAKHLLDLIRQTFIPLTSDNNEKPQNHISFVISCWHGQKPGTGRWNSDSHPFLRLITSARRLRNKGVVLVARKKADTCLDIQLKNDVLEIPPLFLDDFIGQVFLNFVAFEQLYGYCSNHITSYVAFMGCLMNDEADARFLSKKGIVENYFDTDEEVSRFFKSIGKDAAFDISRSYLAEVFEGVNKHTSKWYLVRYNELAYTFFGSPWSLLASCAALLLLVLTFIQTFFTAYSYYRIRSKNN